MHLYTRIGLLMAICLVARSSAVLDDISEDRKAALALREGNRIYQERQANREPRRIKGPRTTNLIDELLGIVVDFNSADCDEGECLSAKQCSAAGVTEVPEARCAGGFGVCCITGEAATEEPGTEGTTTETPSIQPPPPTYNGSTEDDPDRNITGDGGDFFNEGFDEGESFNGTQPTRNNVRQDDCSTRRAYLFPGPDVVQVKVDIRTLNIVGPVDGDCSNDTLVFINANPGLEIPTLCGNITDQTLYIGIDNTVGIQTIELSMCNAFGTSRSWKIGISFLEKGDARLAPPRCLQYFTETTGAIKSFNFEGSPPMKGMMLNNQIYSICFKYISGYCDISFNAARFDLGNIGGSRRVTDGPADVDCDDEFVRVGTSKYCGDYIDMMVTANSSTVIGIDVVSSSINEIQVEGFNATYTMMMC